MLGWQCGRAGIGHTVAEALRNGGAGIAMNDGALKANAVIRRRVE
jgi:hypothetical protein